MQGNRNAGILWGFYKKIRLRRQESLLDGLFCALLPICYDASMQNLQKLQLRPFQLTRLSGIPLMIDYTWFPVVVLHFALVSIFYLPQQAPAVGLIPSFVIGAVLTVLMFGSIILHEMAHALAARLEGIDTTEIRLHIFGGYARLACDPRTAMGELRIAIAGPVASFLLSLLFLGLLVASEMFAGGASQLLLRGFFLYLFTGNAALAMFNLIPGLPLDGGRVLRAYLWHRSGNILTATRIAKRLGVALAYMLGSYGIYRTLWWQDPFTGIWMLVLGFMLKRSAEEDYQYRLQQSAVSVSNPALKVGSLIQQPVISASPDLTIREFINGILRTHPHTVFPVAISGRLHGMLSLVDLKAVPEAEWEEGQIQKYMRPVEPGQFVSSDVSIEAARSRLAVSELGALAVIDSNGYLVGLISSGDLPKEN